MRKKINQCVDCPKEIGCLGKYCPNVDVVVSCCDRCGDYATLSMEGYDYCEDCAKDFLQELFDELTILEKAEVLGEDIEMLD